MSEHAFTNEEYIADLRTPEEQMEMVLLSTQIRAKQLSARKIETAAEASELIVDFIDFTTNQLEKITSDFSHIEIAMSGEGVCVPSSEWKSLQVGENEGLGLIFSSDDRVKALEAYETVNGYIEGVTSTLAGEEGDYTVQMYLVAVLSDMDKRAIEYSGTGINLVEITAVKRALVELSGSAGLSVLSLERLRQKYDLQAEIARHGLTNSTFKRHLGKLEQILHTEKPDDFIYMNDITIIRRLGALGGACARRSNSSSQVVSRAILDAIGDERGIQLGYTDTLEEGISTETLRYGLILDVLMPSSQDDTTQPTLVLEPAGEFREDGPVSVRFNSITSFRF